MTKRELKTIMEKDASHYYSFSKWERVKMALTNDPAYMIQKYMKYLRWEEYFHKNSLSKGKIIRFIYKIWKGIFTGKKNILGNRLGFYIKPGSLDAGVVIYHHGSIIINGEATLGSGCKLHGNNCIGNNGISPKAPHIGENVDIGFGASVIGNITIADNVKIGTGAVVVKSCFTEGALLVGVPAREISPVDKIES